MKQVTIKTKLSMTIDGTFKAIGTFPSLKGMLRGSGKTLEEAISELKKDAQKCFSVPVKVLIKEIPTDADW